VDWWSWLINLASVYQFHMKRSVAGYLFLLLFFGTVDLPAQAKTRGERCIVWYNVENLFYPDSDSTASDDEFTPQGLRHWTWSRYRNKLTALAKVIIASGRGDPPELVALCEVENALVLEDLSAHPILAPYHYTYLHRESHDHRGMDVACLVRKGKIESVQWEVLPFLPPVSETRDLMHISLSWGHDTLDIFLVHLLSKYGGAGATANLRRSQTAQVVQHMDSVYAVRQRALIMAAGDFNDAYEAYTMEPLRKARFGGDSLTPMLPENGKGTYKYRGQWSPIDQVLVLQSLQQSSIAVSTLLLAPLLTEDLSYGGIKPRRTYEGYSYKGGISDHLPLVIDLTPSLFSARGGQ
jgi:endonuclease/exonuclease/phosphatase family metal-dependent hydrolase